MSQTSVSSATEKRGEGELGEKVVVMSDTEPGKDQGDAITNGEEHPKGFRLAMVILALVLSVFLVALDLVTRSHEQQNFLANIFQSIIATAIPRITDHFHSLDQIGWYGSAFFLTLASFQSTWGKAYKYFPLKAVFIYSICIFELGSLLCGMLTAGF